MLTDVRYSYFSNCRQQKWRSNEHLRKSIYFSPLQTSFFRYLTILLFETQPIVHQFKEEKGKKKYPHTPGASKNNRKTRFTSSFQVPCLVLKPLKALSLNNFHKSAAEGCAVDDASLPQLSVDQSTVSR